VQRTKYPFAFDLLHMGQFTHSTISAAFTAKAAAWLRAQASGDGRRRPLVTLRKQYRSRI